MDLAQIYLVENISSNLIYAQCTEVDLYFYFILRNSILLSFLIDQLKISLKSNYTPRYFTGGNRGITIFLTLSILKSAFRRKLSLQTYSHMVLFTNFRVPKFIFLACFEKYPSLLLAR